MKIELLQWAAGSFCAVIGALMLVAPHQFDAPAYTALQPQLLWWGLLFLLSGASLIGTAALAPRRPLAVAAHAAAGTAFLLLAGGFVGAGIWRGTAAYSVLGLGTLLAPLLATRASPARQSFFCLLIGVAAVAVGLTHLTLPDQFDIALYQATFPAYGILLLLSGGALVATQVVLGVPRWSPWAAQLLVAGAFVSWMLMVSLPSRAWTGVALYGGLGTLTALQPWLEPRLQRLKPNSLRSRLALALAAVAALPLIATTALVTSHQARLATTQALTAQETLATALVQGVADYVNLHRAATAALAAQPDLFQLPVAQQRTRLLAAASAYTDSYDFATVDADGDILARSGAGPLQNIADLAVFRNAVESGEPSLEVLFSPRAGQPLFGFGVPVYDEAGNLTGVVTSALASARVQELLDAIHSGAGSRAYLVDHRGQVVAHPDALLTEELTDPSTLPPVAALLRNPTRTGSLEYAAADGPRLAGFASVPELGWGVVVDQPRSEALAPMRAGRELAFGLLLVGIAAAVLIGLVTARRLAAPLGHLARAADVVATRERAVPLPTNEVEEIAHLAAAFEKMQLRLAERTAQRARSEAILRQERDFSEMVINSLPGIFYLFDSSGRIVRWNRRLEQVSGYAPEEIKELHPLDMVPPEGKRGLSEATQQAFEHGHMALETDLVAKGGETLPLVLTGGRLFIDGEAYLVGIGVDIGERRAAEEEVRRLNIELEARVQARTAELEALNQELEAFNYSVAHDLRAPLRGIDGFSQALLEDYGASLDDRGVGYVERIAAGARRMGRLIDDLLDLSRLSRQEMSWQRVDMSGLAREIAGELASRQPERQVAVEIAVGLSAEGDARLLAILLENLLGNAWKFTRNQDRACIEFGALADGDPAAPGLAPGVRVYYVRDNGAGFDMEYSKRLFKAFQRLHTPDEFEGTGVGLATVERIVRRHGGKIWAQGRPGEGATFYFTLSPA